MEKKNLYKESTKQDLYHLKMLQRSKILKMKLLTLFVMALRKDFRLAYRILITFFLLIPVNLLLLLAYLVRANPTSLTKWLSDITVTIIGRRLLHHQKMRQRIYMLIN